MTTRNDVTGDPIKTRPASKEYRENFEDVFGKKDEPANDPEEPCEECGRDASTMGHDPWCSANDELTGPPPQEDSFAGFCDCGRPAADPCGPCAGEKTKDVGPLVGPGGTDDVNSCPIL